MILVDTSVLLDVLTADAQWGARSEIALRHASQTDELAINDIVYAELSARYGRIEKLDSTIAAMELRHEPIPRAALFLAGKAFITYRGKGGTKTGVLSDFFIGAHAAVAGYALLTRDFSRVRSYFPTVRLIGP